MRPRPRFAADGSIDRDQLEGRLLAGRQWLAGLRRLDHAAVFLADELRGSPRFFGIGDVSGPDFDRLAAEAQSRLASRHQVLRPVALHALTGADEETAAVGGDP